MEQAPFDEQLTVRERNQWLLGLSILPALAAFALLFSRSAGLAPPLIVLSVIAVVSLLRNNPVPVLTGTRVLVEPDLLRIGDATIARAKIRDAWLVPLKNGKLAVRVWQSQRLPVDLLVEDKDQGRRLLRALGFDATQTVAKFRILSRLMGHWLVSSGLAMMVPLVALFVLGALLEPAPELFAAGVKGLALFLATAFVGASIPARADIGADGVLITWLGTKQFLPLGKMRAVEQAIVGWGKQRLTGARITMEGGQVVWMPVGGARWADERTGALVERIREAMDTHARGSVDAAAAILGRRARDVRDWIRELRRIGSGANVDLRTAPVNPEHLWRIVESHAAEPEARAAAAVALGGELDDDGRQRLRVAVDAVADERLRVAIDATMSADDAALEGALGELSDASTSEGPS